MTRLSIPDMSCGHCKAAIEKAVSEADVLAVLEFDMEARTLAADTALEPDALLKILADEGYPSTVIA